MPSSWIRLVISVNTPEQSRRSLANLMAKVVSCTRHWTKTKPFPMRVNGTRGSGMGEVSWFEIMAIPTEAAFVMIKYTDMANTRTTIAGEFFEDDS